MDFVKRQKAIEYLYVMLEGHRHIFNLQILSQISDKTSSTEINELADKVYDTPYPGVRPMTEETAKRFIYKFGGTLTDCENDPMSYPILFNKLGDRIGIIMQ